MRALPPEIDFLARQGASPEQLSRAVDAAPYGVSPVESLLGEGIMPEDAYYRALARHLACEYYDGETPFAPEFDPVRGLRSGVAPLVWNGHGARAVIAPRAQSVPHLMEMALSGRVGPGSFAVSSPQRFAALVRERRGGAILYHALGRLPASLSARGGLSGAQIAALVAIVLCAVWLLAISLDALQTVASAGLWLAFSASIAS
jgi:hypothetical protein